MSKTILLVDDEPVLLELYQEIIEGYGIKCICANDGAEALDLFHANRIHLIITDLKMPKIDGLELIRKIRLIDEQIPILVVSSYLDEYEVKGDRIFLELRRTGRYDLFFEKPSFLAKVFGAEPTADFNVILDFSEPGKITISFSTKGHNRNHTLTKVG